MKSCAKMRRTAPRDAARRRLSATLTATAVVVSSLTLLAPVPVRAQGPPLPGAVFTTDVTCTTTNQNIYLNKADVYLIGGPAHPGAAGLAPGDYYVQVTEPNGTVLGSSVNVVGGRGVTPVHVLSQADIDAAPVLHAGKAPGDFAECYQLAAIVRAAGTGVGAADGYNDTSNPGGEYKVWVSSDPGFANNSTKTDNFKVKQDGPPPERPARLTVEKFYDTNTDGTKQDGEPLIQGWRVAITYDPLGDPLTLYRETTFSSNVLPGTYLVTESAPLELDWKPTTPTSFGFSLASGQSQLVRFGNVCLGAGGGHTLGFWSNKNGMALFQLSYLSGQNLRKANGDLFMPPDYGTFRSWILSATATNMAYMLSAQMAAMKLNVSSGFVSAGALIYAPGTNSANLAGFASVGDILKEANVELGLHGLVLSDSPYRAYQDVLKNALDNANNNLTFVQSPTAGPDGYYSGPCSFSFPPLP